jgi:tetratricopeptide (TPR) repeat protein
MEALASTPGEPTDPYQRVRLHWSLGRLSLENARPLAALESLRRAVALLEATQDSIYLARAHLNYAHGLIEAGDLDEAFRRIAQAEQLLGPGPDPSDLAAVRRLQALCAAGAGRFDEAERLGQEALSLATAPKERGHIWWAIAEARVGAGAAAADDAFQHAVDLLAEHGTVREHADVLRTYGRYLRDAGREHEALGIFEQAADVASEFQEPSNHPDV